MIFRLDRLYMVEWYDFDWENEDGLVEDEPFGGYCPEMGRRVIVLSPTGELLQVHSPRLAAGHRLEGGMAIFDCKLVLLEHSQDGAFPGLIGLHGV